MSGVSTLRRCSMTTGPRADVTFSSRSSLNYCPGAVFLLADRAVAVVVVVVVVAAAAVAAVGVLLHLGTFFPCD